MSLIAQSVDLSTLTIKKDLWIDTELSEHIADIVYSATLKKSKGRVYFLIEHKSVPDKNTAVQNLDYINQIWRFHKKQFKNKMKFPEVIVIIIYSGKRKWNIDNSTLPQVAIITGTDKFVPDYRSFVIDLILLC